ncbi:PKD domain-containing protein [Paludibacter jiangxiensis]|uniref:Gliding motility-associated C-terminal domain-containing protein n=1 Tax=Paludibacter jiangxiensis TaxID=681398 RepID=A0A170ZG16_9BACT|nr:PKD domain-containing protein [Paludibacter jiangxiensis]GAT62636.1 gliding motility-associated C-terminal domain-containing protein [Paludibacter jiangxiensis]
MKSPARLIYLVLCIFLYSTLTQAINRVSSSGKSFKQKQTQTSKSSAQTTALSASISANSNSVCQNGVSPVITFSGTGGGAPYTFTYTINTGADLTITTSGTETVTLNVPTSTPGISTYTLKKVTDKDNNPVDISSQAVTVNVYANPTVDFAFTDNQCTGNGVLFTPSAPGTGSYKYSWNFGDGSTSSESNPSHTFMAFGSYTQNFDVKLTVTDNGTTCSQISTKTISVNKIPDASLTSDKTSTTFNGIQTFKTCSNSTTEITFTNLSTTPAINSTYEIIWGDGSAPLSQNAAWSTVKHTYPAGLWNLTYKITGSNGCIAIQKYIVFVGSNPAVSLGNPGNTDICITSPLTFPITGTENNPPGTTYTVTFNDGSSPEVFNHPAPSQVTHTFLKSSCGTSSSDGSTTYSDSFYAKIVATNPCGTSAVSVVPIYISTPPKANYTLPSTQTCINTPICLSNNSTDGSQASSNGCSGPKVIWSITPSDGVVLNSGSLGNDRGSDNTNTWTSGSFSICPVFTIAGTYTITLKEGSNCGIDQKTQTICVEPTPTKPTFDVDKTTGCSPLTSKVTNTITSNTCSTPTYLWKISYTPGFGGTYPAQYTYNSLTVATPTFTFTTPGTYRLSLTVTSACGSITSDTKEIIVKGVPSVSISPIASICGPGSVTPSIYTLEKGTPDTDQPTYNWTFPGGTPATSTQSNPGAIAYNNSGTVSLSVTNECGTSATSTQTVTVKPVPKINNTDLSQTTCSGQPTTAVTLIPDIPGTTFKWSATINNNLKNYITNGTASAIPIQTITNVSTNPQTLSYTITPSLGGCDGTPVTYTITVNPGPSISDQPKSGKACIGDTPAALSVTASNFTGTPAYQWYSNTSSSNSGGTELTEEKSSTFNPPGTPAGTKFYYCKISFEGGCSELATIPAAVTIYDKVSIVLQPKDSKPLCVDGIITTPLSVSVTGGDGFYSYQWHSTPESTPGTLATGSTYTPPPSTIPDTYSYYVIVQSEGSGCAPVTSNTANVKVVDKPTITTQPKASQTLCKKATPDPLTVVANGGINVFAYQWYKCTTNVIGSGTPIDGATSSTYNPATSAVGTLYYYCLVTQPDGAGCYVTSDIATVIVNEAAEIIEQPQSSEVCMNGIATPLSVKYQNGVGTPTYKWYSTNADGTSSASIDYATTDSYIPPTNEVGTKYYYCQIDLPSGGCSTLKSTTATVVVNAIPTIDKQPIPEQKICVGGSSQPLTATYTGGAGTASYQWYENSTESNSGGTAIPGATGASYTPSPFTSAGTKYYYVAIKLSGNNCGSMTSDLAKMIIVDDPTITTQPLTPQTVCQNGNPTALQVEAKDGIGAFYYQWYSNTTDNTSSGSSITGATDATYMPPSAATGITYYYCKITQDGVGCDATSNTAVVTVKKKASFTDEPKQATYCIGETAADLTVAYQDGAGTPDYQWYSTINNDNTSGTAIPGATDSKYKPATNAPGTVYYYCTITFTIDGCSNLVSKPAQITVNPKAVIATKAALICSGTSFTVSPEDKSPDIVPTGTTYMWTNPVISPSGAITGTSAQAAPQTIISQLLTNTGTTPATATYTVTPTSGSCTGNPFSIVVTVNPSIKVVADISHCTCYGSNNGAINCTISGGVPFSSGSPQNIAWTGPDGFTATTTNISNLKPGTYSLVVSDNSPCQFANTYTITEPDDIVISTDSKKDITCHGAHNGSVSISLKGGTLPYSFVWIKDGISYATSEDISNLSPGKYEVTVSDANHCGPKTMSYKIEEPTELTVTLVSQTNILCYGSATGAVSVTATGGTPIKTSPGVLGYNYLWSGPDGYTSTNQNITDLKAGHYTLNVTDQNGCIAILERDLTQNPDIVIEAATTPVTCYGADNASIKLTISGGTAPYKTAWSNLATGTAQDNLSPGDYIITVTDANNCQKSATVTIAPPPVFTIVPVVKNVSCYGANDGSIKLNIKGKPISVVWSDGSTAGNERNNLKPGTYSVKISDGSPCIIDKTFIITEPQPLLVVGHVTDALDCSTVNSGSIALTVSGGTTPYNFIWSNNASTQDITNIQAGNYNVIVSDANNCNLTKQFTVMRPDPINISINAAYDYNCTEHHLYQVFTAKTSGGIPPYQITWSSGSPDATGTSVTTDQSGLISVTVKDSRGCSANVSTSSVIPELGISYKLIDCNKKSYQFDALIVNEATENYSYLWKFGDGSTATTQSVQHQFSSAGIYNVQLTVTGKSCTNIYSKAIMVEAIPTLTIAPEPKLCKGDSITIQASGADIFKWNDGSVSDSLVIRRDGDYSVKGMTTAGCYNTLAFTATYYPSHEYPILSDKNNVTLKDPTINLWSDDHPALYYLWNFGDSSSAGGWKQTHTYNIAKDGYYDILLNTTDMYGCKSTTSKRVWIINDTDLNTFTPNNDGYNDIFLKGWHIKVYNRNGVLVYEGNNGWDGTYKGKLVSPDTYFYIVYYMSANGTKTKEGYVTVVR